MSEDPSYNDKCPICLEEGDMFRLSCHHQIHLECAEGLTDPDCPICREKVDNWPDDLSDKLAVNYTQRRQELEEEEREELLAQHQAQQQESLRNITVFLNPPADVVISAAQDYLREQGVPLRYMPNGMVIRAETGPPRTSSLNLFMGLVGQSIQKMEDDISNFSEDDEDLDSEDNPFQQEDQLHRMIDGVIEIWGTQT